jgi:catechol 2,3-dioxygenase-like lactoylglutathione lyase family enzyme
MQVKRISHVTFRTPDLERQIDYYAGVLGMQLAARETNRAVLATRQGLLAVVLERGDAQSCEKVAFQLPPGSDLSELRHGLSADGIAADLQSDAAPGVRQLLAFKDPKGTMIEVFSEIALIDKDPGQSTISPLKLGHLAFNVLDVKAVTDFYIKHLGFRVSDWRGDVFVFLRCGPDHHTVNFVLSHTNTVKMHHAAFELKDWAEIQRACDFLGKNNYRLIWGPGRHLIGHNVFTYHRNPDGQIIELYTELDQLKDEDIGYFEPRAWHQDHPQRPKTWPMDTLSNYWGAGSPPGFGD